MSLLLRTCLPLLAADHLIPTTWTRRCENDSDKKWKDRTCPLPKLRLNRKRENTHTQNTLDGTDLGTGLAASVPSNAIYDEHIACCTCRTCALVECAPHVLLQGESAKRPVRPSRPALLRSLEVQQSFCEGHCIVDHRGMSPDKSKTIWNQINQIAIYYNRFLGMQFFPLPFTYFPLPELKPVQNALRNVEICVPGAASWCATSCGGT